MADSEKSVSRGVGFPRVQVTEITKWKASSGRLEESAQNAIKIEALQNKVYILQMTLQRKEEELKKQRRTIKECNREMRDFLDVFYGFVEKAQSGQLPGKPQKGPSKTRTAVDKPENSERLHSQDSDLLEEVQMLRRDVKEKHDALKEFTEKFERKKMETENLTLQIDDLENKLQKITKERTALYERASNLEAAITNQPTERVEGAWDPEVEKYKCLAEKQKGELEVLHRRQSELVEKLSQEWSSKISSSERDIENINIKNRPMNIASEYEALFSNEWLDVKTDLDSDDKLSEDDKMTTLCTILLKAEKTANSKFREVMASVTENLQLPLCTMFPSPFVMTKTSQTQTEIDAATMYTSNHFEAQTQIQDAKMAIDADPNDAQQSTTVGPGGSASVLLPGPLLRSGELGCINSTVLADQTCPTETPMYSENTLYSQLEIYQYLRQSRSILAVYGQTDLQTLTVPKHFDVTLHNTLGDILRLNADDVNLGSLEMQVMQFTQKQFSKHGQEIVCHNLSMKKYVKACCRLCWKMAIQRPKMAFICKGVNSSWDPHTQDVFFGAVDPTLKDTVVRYYVKPSLVHDDKLMVKGQIMTKLSHQMTNPH